MNYSNTTNHIMWSLCLSSLWLYTATLCSLSTLTITPAAVVIYGKSQSRSAPHYPAVVESN